MNTDYVFYRAIRKYGWDNLIWEIIDNASSEEELNCKEIYWIDYYNTYIHANNSNGYNMTLGGDGANGFKFTEEEKNRLSKLKQGKYLGEDNPFYNKHHTEKIIEKIKKTFKSNYKKENHPFYNKKHKKETIDKIINTLKGKLAGENHPNVKIAEETAKEIKIRLANGEKGINIANNLNITIDIIRNIKSLKTWVNLLPELNEIIKNNSVKIISEDKAKEIKIRIANKENPKI